MENAIAEVCGWKKVITPTHEEYTFAGLEMMPERIEWHKGETIQLSPPDFCNDLNAMHKAEKVLNKEQKLSYVELLEKSCFRNKEPIWWSIHATALHRSEAFLRTIGKWKE